MAYGWHQASWGPGQWVFMALAMVAIWAVIIVGIVLAVRHFGVSRQEPVAHPTQADAAEVILRERFARGELTEAQFRQQLGVLRGGP